MSSVVCINCRSSSLSFIVFFFNDTATTEIYTRSLVGQRQMCIRDSDWGLTVAIEPPELEMRVAILKKKAEAERIEVNDCLLYTSPSPRDRTRSRMPSSA